MRKKFLPNSEKIKNPSLNNSEVAVARQALPPFTSEQKIILTMLCSACCMVVLDFSIVNVALPSIQTALQFTTQKIQWLITGYGLVLGGFLLLGGRLADLYGRKKIFIYGTALFTLASFLGGFSTSQTMLIAMRCLQGLGAALLMPASLALLIGHFPEGSERNRALGIWGTVAAAGYSIGVILGGILTSKVGWRGIFFVNVPFGIALILSVIKFTKESKSENIKRNLDITGSLLVTSGLILFVYALVQSSVLGWKSQTIQIILFSSLVLLTAFFILELRIREPLIQFSIFKLPGILTANILSTLMSASLVAMNLLLTLYLQGVLHYSPFYTGLAFLPHGLMACFSGPWGGRLVTRIGSKPVLMGGMACILIGLFLLTFISTQDHYWWIVFPGTVLISIGGMPAFTTMTMLATSGVEEKDHGLVSGVLETTSQLGGAIGLATITAIAASQTTAHQMHSLSNSLHQNAALLPESLVYGYRWGLWLGVAFIVIALFLGQFGLKKNP